HVTQVRVGSHERKARGLQRRYIALPVDTPHDKRQQQQQQRRRRRRDQPTHPRRPPRSTLFYHPNGGNLRPFAQNLLHFRTQLRRRNVHRRTLPHRIQKVEFAREERRARLTIREMHLNHSAFFTLQLVVEIQGQTATYILTRSQFFTNPFLLRLLSPAHWFASSKALF